MKSEKKYIEICYIHRGTISSIKAIVAQCPNVSCRQESYEFGDGDVLIESRNVKNLVEAAKDIEDLDNVRHIGELKTESNWGKNV